MLNPDRRESLRVGALGKYLDEHELAMLLKYNEIYTFEKDEIILKQGNKAEGIYIILDGSATSTTKLLGQGTATIERLSVGNFFGEISYVEDCPSAMSIIAAEKTHCLLMNHLYLELLASHYAVTRYKIMNAVAVQACVRLKVVHDKIISYLSQADMLKKSFLSEVLHSFVKSEEVSQEKFEIKADKLLRSPFFKSFEKNEIDELVKLSHCVMASKNYTLISPTKVEASCFIVIDGAVQTSIVHDNKFAKLSVIGPGILFAPTSFINTSNDVTVTFVTCERSVLLLLSADTMESFRKNNISLWYKLFSLACRSFIALEKSMDKLDVRLQIETYNR